MSQSKDRGVSSVAPLQGGTLFCFLLPVSCFRYCCGIHITFWIVRSCRSPMSSTTRMVTRTAGTR
jgi:hypothetical protein